MEKVTSFVVKVASRCNLNCSYCYMYNMGDNTYMDQPKFMSEDTITHLARKLKNYTEASEIENIALVFHGGEPLLCKKEFYENFFATFKKEAPDLNVEYLIQTNGVTLDQEWYDFFNANGVIVGISMDGPEEFHDKYRVNHKGEGSYEEVSRAIRLGNTNNLSCVLMVINEGIPPAELYAEMKNVGTKRWNLLFPDGHYQNLSDGFDREQYGHPDHTPYGDWLIELYKIWKADSDRTSIYLFESLVKMIVGQRHIGDQLMGRKTNGVLVIETDGSIEIVDSIRACYEGITRNDLSVHTNEIMDLFDERVFGIYYNAHDQVCEKCLNCPVYDICGGGFLGHRYSIENGFDNPTIYCKDMIRFITFLQNDFLASFPPEVIENLGVDALTYEEVLAELEKPTSVKIEKEIKEGLTSFSQPLMLPVI